MNRIDFSTVQDVETGDDIVDILSRMARWLLREEADDVDEAFVDLGDSRLPPLLMTRQDLAGVFDPNYEHNHMTTSVVMRKAGGSFEGAAAKSAIQRWDREYKEKRSE
jgi:hypothetical protein